MKATNIINFLLVISLVSIVVSCSQSEGKSTTAEGTQPVPVKLSSVQTKTMAIPIQTVGTVSAEVESSLSFKTGGIIQKVYVESGQEVKKGQLLATLDLSEIKAGHKKALAAFDKAERELNRMKNLYKDKVTTLEALENAQTVMDVATSDLEIVQFNLNYSKILAPSTGVILTKSAENGELVSGGQSIFNFGGTQANWVIKSGLVDKEIVRVNIGDEAHVTFDAYPGSSFKGRISKIASAPTTITGTYEIEIALLDVPANLKKGFVARVSVIPSLKRQYTLIPIEALIDAEEEEGYVFKVENQKPIKLKVRIESILNDQVLVTGEVSANDQIVTDGSTEINEESILMIQ